MLANDALLSSSESSDEDQQLRQSLSIGPAPLPASPYSKLLTEPGLYVSRLPLKQNEYESYELFSKKKLQAESERNSSKQTNGKAEVPRAEHSSKAWEQISIEQGASVRKEQSERVHRDSTPLQTQVSNRMSTKVQSSCDCGGHLKNLLELEIQKNRELEQSLFQRQRQIVELRTKLEQKEKQQKLRKSACRSVSPKLSQLKTVKQIEEEITQLKQQYRQIENSPRHNKTLEDLKRQNGNVKLQNKKLKKFFRAFTDSLELLQGGKRCGPDVKDVWLSWKELFPKVAEYLGAKSPDN